MKRGPRWMHRLWAYLLGYFWAPCPVCGREFGGHEWDGQGIPKRTEPYIKRAVCSPECVDEWQHPRPMGAAGGA